MDTTKFIDDLKQIPNQLTKLAERLETAPSPFTTVDFSGIRRLLLLGMGSSFYAADVLAREARAEGLAVNTELASTEHLPEPADDLLVIAISATGGSVEVLDACEKYRGTGRLVALTNNPGSKITEMADQVIEMYAGVETSGVACRTFRHTLVMLRGLLQQFGMSENTPLLTLAHHAAEANAALLDTRADWLATVAATLESEFGTWILAPVERLSSARQSALMMREVPRNIAYASETGDWSHVDVYLTTEQDYKALIFAGSRWDGPALDWMEKRGSTFVAVGRGTDGKPLPNAAHTIEFPHQDNAAVAQLTEPLIGELVATHWHG